MKRLMAMMLLAMFSVGMLSACNTTKGFGQDVEKVGDKIEDAADGGFHHYALEADWTRPQTEKLLTVNARALRLYPRCGFEVVDTEHYYRKRLGAAGS